MLSRSLIAAVAALATLVTMSAGAVAQDSRYPDWRGQWMRIPVRLPTQPSHDQTKPWGKGQEAPLTPEYQAVLEASIADQAQGGLGNFPTTTGRAAGMPHMMMGFGPMEFVVTPDTTYVLIGWYDHSVASLPTAATGRRRSIRRSLAIRSASGSTRTAMGATTCSKSRPALQRTAPLTMKSVCPCTSITNLFSRNASIAIRPIQKFFTMSSRRSTTR